jgi:exodeoxyribonuclease V alpha subunit
MVLAAGLRKLFPGAASLDQRWAAAAAVLGRLSVIAGGPGTGKTTTVARLIALLVEQAQAAGADPPLVALAAPTGKAAARMEEAVRAEAKSIDIAESIRQQLTQVRASTIHRLLGTQPGSASRFRHDRGNRLPHDVVIIDETSMVSLGLMARLLEAVRDDARLVLVGDPEQLASVEAGAVLADIVGPAAAGSQMSLIARERLGLVAGSEPDASTRAAGAIGDGVVLLRANHRFGGALASLATAVRGGDGDAVVAALRSDDPSVCWIESDPAPTAAELAPLRQAAAHAGEGILAAASRGDAVAALAALGTFRLLCAHRRGPSGAAVWNAVVESWLSLAVEGFSAADNWYVGRPVILTANDYGLRLFNGDAGVVVDREREASAVAFNRDGSVALVSPSRLANADTVWAMTVHKAQGSEFDQVALLLPDPMSRILTRELFYTAVTRARERVFVVGSEEALRAAVARRLARASGLADRLWVS